MQLQNGIPGLAMRPAVIGAPADVITVTAGTGVERMSLLESGYRAADRMMSWLLLAHVPLILALAPLRGTWAEALLWGVGSIAAACAVAMLWPGSTLSRFTITTVLFGISALIIHQTGGMIEMHFQIFAGLAFLLLYRDWRLPVWGGVVVALHHSGFNLLQMRGSHAVMVFQDHMGWHIVAVHAAWVVFEVVILVYIARVLASETVQAEHLVALAESLGAGDLTMRARRGAGAAGDAVEAVNWGMARLGRVVAGIRARSDEVAEVAAALSATTEHVTGAAGGVAASLSQVAQAAQEHAESTQRVAGTLRGMVQSIDGVAERAGGVSEASRRAMEVARDGSRVIQQAVGRLEGIRDTVLRSAGQIREMQEYSERIDRITQAITDIASQTNLLALNAAIEAARAGEQGRGFAVVASEVRVLASRSGESAAEAAELIRSIKDATTRAVETMGRGTAQVEDGAALAGNADAALREIMAVVEDTMNDVGAISTAAAQIADESRHALLDMGLEADAAGASEHLVAESSANATAAEDAAAAVEEIGASMQEMSASAEELARIARELRGEVARFRIDASAAAASGEPAAPAAPRLVPVPAAA
jgi:methyl-accepting chemotaxis protein